MTSIGEPVEFSEPVQKLLIINSLRSLHELGIFHGDARPSNIIMVETRLIWIDFMNARWGAATAVDFMDDMSTLLRSLYGAKELPETTQSLLNSYHENLSNANYAEQMRDSVTDSVLG